MHAALSTLDEPAELDTLLGGVLRTIVAHLDEAAGGIWLYEAPHDLLRLHLDLEAGVISAREVSRHPGGRLESAGQSPVNRAAHNGRYRAGVAMRLGPEHLFGDPSWAPYADHFRATGVRSLLSLPLFAGETFLGCVTIRARRADAFAEVDIAFAQALADQASLALHIARLAAHARDAAVERERSVELARANAALREGLAFFSDGKDVDGFLRHQLKVIADQFGSTSAGLWIEEPRNSTSRLVLSLEDGRVVDGTESNHPFAGQIVSTNLGHPTSDRLRLDQKPVLWPADKYRDPSQPMFDPAVADALEASGTRAILLLPLVAGGANIGAFSYRLPTADAVSPARLELAQALANQAALALHLSRLATAERETAVLRERAAVLARANAALAKSAAALTARGDLDGYLGTLLGILLEQMESDSGSLWLKDEDDWFHLHTEVQHGRVIPREETTHPGARAGVSGYKRGFAAPTVAFHTEQAGGALFYPDVATAPEYDGEEETRAYLLAQGVRSQLIVPMFAGERRVGSFAVRAFSPRSWTNDQIELAEALACQAALAIEMDRLAADARVAAVAREREAAARARADKLAAANALLRQSAERLGAIEDIDAFLGQVLLTITNIMGARSATVWTEDADARVTHLRYVVTEGRAVPAATSGHPNAFEPLKIPDVTVDPMRDRYTSHAKTIVQPIGEVLVAADTRAYLRELGAQALLSVPMVLAGAHLGTFTVRLDDDQPIPDDDRELIQALADQAAVALHLTSLAAEARETALAREREESALRRAEVLARANAAIRRSLDRLSEREDLSAFLGEVVQVCATELSAVGVGVWMRRDESNLHTLLVSFEDGEVRHAGLYANPGVSRHPVDGNGFARGEIEVTTGPELRARDWYPIYREYLEARGIVAIASVPLFIGGRWVGAIVLRFTYEPELPEEWRELAHALGNQVALALELTRLGEEARAMALTSERNRLAREIHDTLAQGFAAIRLQLTLANEAGAGSATAAAALALAHEIASENLVEARRSMILLKEGPLSFADELRAVIAGVQRLGGPTIAVHIEAHEIDLPRHVSHELSRVAQEALLNAVKHAAANQIKVELKKIPSGVRMSVSDDGKGFDSARIGQGFGLDGLRDRCATIKAELSIVSEPGRGTEVIATWSAPTEPDASPGEAK